MPKLTREQILQAYKDGKISSKESLSNFIMLEELKEKIEEGMPNITNVIELMKETRSYKPSSEELLNLIRPLIPEVKDGITPTNEELLALIKPLIPKIENGKTPTKKELLDLLTPLLPDANQIAITATERAIEAIKPLIPDISSIEKNLPILGTEIRNSLELLDGEERLDKSAVKGLDDYEEVKKMASESKKIVGGGSIARNFYQLFDAPQTYSDQNDKIVKVNSAETGLEFGLRLTVSATAPTSPSVNDLWVDIS